MCSCFFCFRKAKPVFQFRSLQLSAKSFVFKIETKSISLQSGLEN